MINQSLTISLSVGGTLKRLAAVRFSGLRTKSVA